MTWEKLLENEYSQPYFRDLINYVRNLRYSKTIYPNEDEVFNALKLTPFEEVKVVIIGQDPYHGKDQAHGLAFSVKEGVTMPPSLRNIFLELNSDLGIIRRNTNLSDWAKQGVLLLNTIFTVEEGKPLSHAKLGWQRFSNKIISLLNEQNRPIIFVLWGNNAIALKDLIDNPIHKVITSSHPSPFSARYSFFGSRPFSTINKFLTKNNFTPINW